MAKRSRNPQKPVGQVIQPASIGNAVVAEPVNGDGLVNDYYYVYTDMSIMVFTVVAMVLLMAGLSFVIV